MNDSLTADFFVVDLRVDMPNFGVADILGWLFGSFPSVWLSLAAPVTFGRVEGFFRPVAYIFQKD